MAPGFIGTESMNFPNIKAPVFKINDGVSGAFATIAGIILSMWANCTFVASVTEGRFDPVDVYILMVNFISHVLISYVSSTLLIQGFARKNPNLLQPWIILKALELVLVFIGLIINVCLPYRHIYIGIVPIAVIILIIGSYLETMVYMAWKYMKQNPNPPAPSVDIETVAITEKPPSYESFTNQTNVI